GTIKVYASILHPDVGYKTLSVTFQTTSKELVRDVLNHYNAHAKDPNLYYVAMETGIKNKESGLPISKMIVLDDDARPLELQACQPQGETKFHLKMKSGGLVRVRTNVLSPENTYKTVFIARCTTSRELIKLIIDGCKTDGLHENFTLREASADFEVDRILQDDEYPLEVQSKWKSEEGCMFFLTRLNKKPDANPGQTSPILTSDELKHEVEKQNQTIDTLNATIHRLQQDRDIRESVMSPDTFSSSYDDLDKDDYDEIDDINHIPPHKYYKQVHHTEKAEERADFVKPEQPRTSIDALDLHNAPTENEIIVESERPIRSQIDKLRHSFDRFHKKSIDDMDLICQGKKAKRTSKDCRRRSQIDRFRHKFLQYYNVKPIGEKRPISRLRSDPRRSAGGRSWSVSDAEYYELSNFPADINELETALSRNSSVNSSCDREIRQVFENSTLKQRKDSSHTGLWTLFNVTDDMELVGVTLKREPGKELGLELAHVSQTGSPIENNPDDVAVYVFHKRDGNTAIFESPTNIPNEGASQQIDYENEVDDAFADSQIHQDNHTCFGSQRDVPASESPCSSNEATEPGSPGACCTLAEWRDGPGPKPRHGVRIVGITKGSIAENTKKLEQDDVIVEVNGRNVLNSTLDVVIETLRDQKNVHLVVAREKDNSEVQKVLAIT
ncbi:hypothetical protein QZH41_008619, partial [Actinostola sp. cb2023]